MKNKLPPKQQRFVDEYLVDLNASAAYLRAGYSAGSPNVCGPRLLAKASIQAAVQIALQKRQQRCEVRQDDVMLSLKRIVDANMVDYAAWDGANLILNPSEKLTREQTYCIQEISMDKDGRVKIKLHDKIAAAVGLLKHVAATEPDEESRKIEVNIRVMGAAANRDDNQS
jgi:phage terminase small subunit